MKPRQPKTKETRLRVQEPQALMPFLMSKMGGMSRNGVKQMLSRRQVSVNGSIETRFDYALQAGDEVLITTGAVAKELTHPKLKIVYEDDHLLVVEKKQGLLTVAAHEGSNEVTCFTLLKKYVRQRDSRAGIYVVHRLDRETSGLLVFAKTKELQHYMRDYWRQLVTRRTYVAVAEGVMDKREGQIRTWLTEDPKTTMVYSSPVDDGGKLAVTNYKVLKERAPHHSSPNLGEVAVSRRGTNPNLEHENLINSSPNLGEVPAGQRGTTVNTQLSTVNSPEGMGGEGLLSLLELNLETGRTNQIRVHLASVGHPVVGDRKYGSGMTPPIDRLALHARVLEFIHPVTEQTVHFETPVPKEFLRLFR